MSNNGDLAAGASENTEIAQITERVCAEIRKQGVYLWACKAAGLSETTAYRWKRKGEKGEPGYARFVEACEKATIDFMKAHMAHSNDFEDGESK